MRRLSIEEWKRRDNPFKKVSKPKKVKTKSKYKPRNKSVLKSKVKPIRDIDVINAAKELAKIVTKTKEIEINNVNDFKMYLNS